jgi:integrase
MQPQSVRDVVALYLDHLRSRLAAGDYSADHFDGVERELTRFASRYGNQLLADCRRHDLTAWLDAHPEWKSPWTRKRIAETICRPFRWAVGEELIAANPYRVPQLRRGKQRRPATDYEYIALMRGGSRELRRALFFMRRTGARTKEVRELCWSQIDFDRSVIVMETHKTDRQQTDPRPRIIGLDPATLRFLRNLQRTATTDRVFVNCDGGNWDRHTFARHMNRWATRLGLDPVRCRLSPYCFRHSYGCNAIEAGVGEKQLADQLGHTTTRMVSYYAQTAGKVSYLRAVAEQAVRRRR